MSNSLEISWTLAHQDPLSMAFPRQEYWSGLPFPSLGDLSGLGIEFASPALEGRFFTNDHQESPLTLYSVQFSSVAQLCPTLWPHELQHARPPCPSPTPGVHSNSCPSSQWCHPAISSSVIPFSSCPQCLPTSESFPMSQLFP